MRQELMTRVEIVMNKACDFRNSFDGYTYLWVDDRQEFMRQVRPGVVIFPARLVLLVLLKREHNP